MSRTLLRRGALVRRRAAGGNLPVVAATDGFDGTGSDLGPGWSLYSGAGARQAGRATSPTQFAALVGRKEFSVGSPDMSAQVFWAVGAPSNDRSVGVFVRFSASAHTGYLVEVNDQFDRFTVLRVIDGAATNISGGFQPVPGGVTTPGLVRAEVRTDASGNPVISAFWKGTLLGTFTDTSAQAIKSGTRGGLQIYNGASEVFIDDFAVAALNVDVPTVPTVFRDGFDGTGDGLASTWRNVEYTGYRDNGQASSAVSNGLTWTTVNDFQAPSPAMFSELIIAQGAPTVDRSAGVLVRAMQGRKRGYLFEANDMFDRVSLVRINDDGTTNGLSGFVSVPSKVNPPGAVRLQVSDDAQGNVVLVGYWGGAVVLTYTDTSARRIRDGVCGGFQLYQPASVLRIDDFTTGGL